MEGPGFEEINIGALIIRIGFGGPLYYSYNKEPQNSIGELLRPTIVYSLLSEVSVQPIAVLRNWWSIYG